MRLWSHIGEKSGETSSPASANSNAARTIILVSGILWVVATLLHVGPADVFGAMTHGKRVTVTIVRAVDSEPLSTGIISSGKADSDSLTATAFRMSSAAQIADHHGCFAAADTTTEPHALAVLILAGWTQARQIAVGMVGQIKGGTSSWQVL
jgi:hypothetical protein